jgi:RNA polymerase-binding transcription factor DksA
MINTDYTPLKLHLEKESKRLNERLENLRSTRFTEAMRDGGTYGELGEEAAESASMENLVAQEEQIMNEIEDIVGALKKFQSGTYGLCEKCSCPITMARLQVVPTARLCMDDARNKPRKSCLLPVAGEAQA